MPEAPKVIVFDLGGVVAGDVSNLNLRFRNINYNVMFY